MQTIGILGGMAPESTLEYYRILIERSHDRGWEKRYPPTIINSLNFADFYTPLSAGDDDAVLEVLTAGVEALARAGADFAVLASNTPHRYFSAVEAAVELPLVSIVDATAAEAARIGAERVGVLGTRYTMDGTFYQEGFDVHGLAVVTPAASEKRWLNDLIFDELTKGEFTEDAKTGLVELVESMHESEGIDAVALACTELPLIVEAADLPVPALNTTALHAGAAFERAVSGEQSLTEV